MHLDANIALCNVSGTDTFICVLSSYLYKKNFLDDVEYKNLNISSQLINSISGVFSPILDDIYHLYVF